MLKSVTLLGSASGRNAGDAALLSCIMDSVDKECARPLLYEIPSFKPSFIRNNYTNRVRPIGCMPWHGALRMVGIPTYKSLMRTDLALVFDATLFDRALYNPLFNFMSSYALLLPQAKKRGKKMGCFTCTVGPVTTPRGKDMLRRVLELMDFITIRDMGDYQTLCELKVENPNIVITNDVALLTTPSTDERLADIWQSFNLDKDKETLALNVNSYFDSWAGHKGTRLTRENFVDIYTKGLSQALKGIDANLLFVSTQFMDETLTREIMNKLSLPHKKALLSNKVYSHHDICGLMPNVSLLSAMRLHCLLLTSASMTPIIGINYLPKVRTYLETLGINDYALNFDKFTPEAIAEHITRGWNDRKKLKTLMLNAIPEMKERARIPSQIIAAIDKGEDFTKIIAAKKNY